jgi:hypothetical protein
VNTSNWELKSYPVPATSGNSRIAIQYAVADGGPNGTNSYFVGIDKIALSASSATDGMVAMITAPVDNCQLSATETVTVAIINTGTVAISNFAVAFNVDSGTAVVETVATSINAGDTLMYTFTTTADLSAAGPHHIDAGVMISGDNNNCNDYTFTSVTSLGLYDPLVTPFTMGFEATEDLTGWAVEDANGDGVTWDIINTFPHTGTNAIRKAGSAANDDDWLFTSCLDMHAGMNYTLDYWYKTFDAVAQCGLEVYIGTQQAGSAMTTVLIQNPIVADTVYHHAIIPGFTVPADGIYFIGFHAISGAGTSALRIDDIWLDDGTHVGINDVKNKTNISVYPNPNSGLFYLSTKNDVKDALVEVFNMNGSKVFSASFNNLNKQVINLNNNSIGIYHVRIISDSNVENHSIIINR